MSLRSPWKKCDKSGGRPSRIRASAVVIPKETREQKLDRAKGYPYVRPSSSFLFINGETATLDDSAWRGISCMREIPVLEENSATTATITRVGELLDHFGVSDCTPLEEDQYAKVLAIGSNAGPSQLARKFPTDLFPNGVVIPVIQGILHDFDVVYTPMVTSYGSCPATLEYSPGVSVEIFVTYLTKPLMERMNATEGAYNLCELAGLDLDLGISLKDWKEGKQGVEKLNSILQYNHQVGQLYIPSQKSAQPGSIALKAIPAHNRQFHELDQEEMLTLIKSTFPRDGDKDSGDGGLDDWILENVENKAIRRKLVDKMSKNAQPFNYDQSTILTTIGGRFSSNIK